MRDAQLVSVVHVLSVN